MKVDVVKNSVECAIQWDFLSKQGRVNIQCDRIEGTVLNIR
jgi:hypothetical protein